MKSVLTLTVAISVLWVNASYADVIAKELTKEEMTPFCQNRMIWDNFDVKFEQCMKASLICTKDIAKKKLDWSRSAEAFNPCVFEKLGIGS